VNPVRVAVIGAGYWGPNLTREVFRPHVVFTDDPHPQCPARLAPRTVWAGSPAVQVRDDITELACFAGIYPHAYAWIGERVRETAR